MPTYAQLQAEPAWRDEYMPPSLAKLAQQIRARLGLSAAAVGSKGDNNHTYGYHRSRRWILSSRWSAYGAGDYSVTSALDRGGDPDWVCALDITIDAARLLPMCRRLDAAVRAGRLPQVREWYGNLDGDRIVDGYDALVGRAASSDPSHLWHLHISLYRSRAGDDHRVLEAVLIGDDTWAVPEIEEDDMVRGIIVPVKGGGIGLVYPHPVTGEMVWQNAGTPQAVEAWQAAGWPKAKPVDKIESHGRNAREVAADILDAMRSGGAGPVSVEVAPGKLVATTVIEPAGKE